MYVKKDMDFNTLMDECWCCEDVLNKIYDEDKEDEFMDFLEEYFYENIPTMTELNDLIRFDWEWIFEQLGIEDEEDDEELDDD
jgi:tRNA U54 and U55 pseudouridine synthase Pus10